MLESKRERIIRQLKARLVVGFSEDIEVIEGDVRPRYHDDEKSFHAGIWIMEGDEIAEVSQEALYKKQLEVGIAYLAITRDETIACQQGRTELKRLQTAIEVDYPIKTHGVLHSGFNDLCQSYYMVENKISLDFESAILVLVTYNFTYFEMHYGRREPDEVLLERITTEDNFSGVEVTE